MAASPTEVEGKDAGKVFVYALSTCVWCKRTKRLLKELGVRYSYVDVDTLDSDEQKATKDTVRRWNPKCSFPTVIVNEGECIVGHNEKKLKEALGL